MRLVILTSGRRDTASCVLPALVANPKLQVVKVVLAHGLSPKRKNIFRRKLIKTWKIGLLGALNGLRLRKWYADPIVDDIGDLCRERGIELVETPYINCEQTRVYFREAQADLGLSLGNGYIGPSIFTIPRCGMINIHGELLPEFQNAQSIIWPIHEGRRETGYTIHQIDNRIDTGEILFQERYPIRFYPTLQETVEKNIVAVREKIPTSLPYVCENYHELKAAAKVQTNGKSYTTPSIWQFWRMVRNHRAMYREQCLREGA